ncbi:hypothetical protein AB0D97_13940 [Streptomyces roseus]|uniref:hypothetical protein n=1 Tax=Streptomyces roseus TaxID=66430 RepID=UPI0033CF8727
MAHMMRSRTWQRATSTYGYEAKGNVRARERRAWLRDYDDDLYRAWYERHRLNFTV